MAKEGIPFVVIPFLLGLIFLLLKIPVLSYIFAVILYIFTAYFAFFFRDPPRKIVARDHEWVSPVDGTILDIVSETDSNRLVVFLSIFNVHVTRLPYNGQMEKIEYFKGKFLPAYRDKASELNEQIKLTVNSKSFKYTLKLIAGIAARRIRMWVHQGDKINTGSKIGIIMFGSRAELFIPKSVSLQVKKGDKVYGGLTLIGKIKNQE
jgi:phosphatidylserine decarboxylase